MLELWVVRHGETDWNVSHRIQGWTDIALNQVGCAQAERLGHHLEGIPFLAILSSDLQRAHVTAQILARRIPLPVATNPLLREQCFGQAEGQIRDCFDRQYPNGAPDAESKQTLAVRARSFLKMVSSQFTNGRVLCVSHGGMIRCMLNVLGAHPIPVIENTSVSKLVFDKSNWSVSYMNWAEHLGSNETPDETNKLTILSD